MTLNKSAGITRWLLLMAAIGGVVAAVLVAVLPSDDTPHGDSASGGHPFVPPQQMNTPAATPATSCTDMLSSLSQRQQLAQLLVVGIDDGTDPATAAKEVGTEQLGGIFIGGNSDVLFKGGALDQVQHASKVPVSIAVDEEGGRVQRIDNLDGPIPSARKMAATMTPDQVKGLATNRGRALRSHGITTDYAPDTDVSDQPDKGAIGDRSFSPDPNVVRTYAQAFAEGLREGGVQPVLKHFPGHGHSVGDSHDQLVPVPPLASLRTNDLVPYQRIDGFGEVAVMVGHLNVPGLTSGDPASLSPAAYQLLRNEYHFTGPVVTDDLGAMKAITDKYRLPDAVLKALQAGADQALSSSGGQTSQVLDRLDKAVASGELPAQRVHDSVVRVLTAKHACGTGK
jgi:beta-N-acetylhexosaminidase